MNKRNAIMLCLTIIFIGICFFPIKCFTISNQNHLIYVKYVGNQEICYSSIHSVSLTPIEEIFIIDGMALRLKRVTYIDQGGAGLPELNRGQEKFEFIDGKFVISNFDREFNNIDYMIQAPYKNVVSIGNEKFHIYKVLDDYERARFEVKRISLINYVSKRLNIKGVLYEK